jgi:hypothetical protein
MITLSENALHQLTIAGTGMLAEARAGHVDVTGWRLLDAPEVVDNGDGSFTLRIAVPEEKSTSRSKRDLTANAPGDYRFLTDAGEASS